MSTGAVLKVIMFRPGVRVYYVQVASAGLLVNTMCKVQGSRTQPYPTLLNRQSCSNWRV
jgi:hypothetical protein